LFFTKVWHQKNTEGSQFRPRSISDVSGVRKETAGDVVFGSLGPAAARTPPLATRPPRRVMKSRRCSDRDADFIARLPHRDRKCLPYALQLCRSRARVENRSHCQTNLAASQKIAVPAGTTQKNWN